MSAAPMLSQEPAAPAILHIDLAALAATLPPAAVRAPAPKLDAMELELLRMAERCAGGDLSMPPRRELIGAALREAERERWWRDEAEAEGVRLRAQVAELRLQRRDLLSLVDELLGWASGVLGCMPAGREVLQRIRAKESWLTPQTDLDIAERMRAEVANG